MHGERRISGKDICRCMPRIDGLNITDREPESIDTMDDDYGRIWKKES
jgi:hypothetical protein